MARRQHIAATTAQIPAKYGWAMLGTFFLAIILALLCPSAQAQIYAQIVTKPASEVIVCSGWVEPCKVCDRNCLRKDAAMRVDRVYKNPAMADEELAGLEEYLKTAGLHLEDIGETANTIRDLRILGFGAKADALAARARELQKQVDALLKAVK